MMPIRKSLYIHVIMAALALSWAGSAVGGEFPATGQTTSYHTGDGGTLSAGSLQNAPAAGPLRQHPTNGRYFTDGSGKSVYLTGSHSWDLFQYKWLWTQDQTWSQYLDFLQQQNHNFIRLWVADTAWSPYSSTPIEPQPYVRTGPGNAADGNLKFDLNQLNQSYFDRLRSAVIAARDRGIYVSIMLFDSWGISRYQSPPDNVTWNYHPFKVGNNINGINGDPNGDTIGFEYHNLQIPAITQLQETYVRRVVDTINNLDNVLYEISNEDDGIAARDWQYYLVGYVRNYEAGKPKQHPVGMTAITEGNAARNGWLFGSSADWISPQATAWDSTSETYAVNPPATDGGRVSILDSDHLFYYNFKDNAALSRAWVWKSFTRGHNPILMEDLSSSVGWIAAGAAMGQTRSYANRMNLAAMTPQDGLSTTTYCLANPAAEYLAYQPGSAAFNVYLNAGTYSVEWFNTVTGSASPSGNVTVATDWKNFTPPFPEAALYLKVTSGGGA